MFQLSGRDFVHSSLFHVVLKKNPGSPKEAPVCHGLVSKFHHDSSRWWFQIFFIFTLIWGSMIHFDYIIFFNWGWFNHQLVMILIGAYHHLKGFPPFVGSVGSVCQAVTDHRRDPLSRMTPEVGFEGCISWRGGSWKSWNVPPIFLGGKNGRIARKVSWVMSEFGSASSEETT